MRKPTQRSHFCPCPHLERLECCLKALEVTRGSLQDGLDRRRRKRRVGLLLGFREEWVRRIERPKREIAAQDMWRWVSKMKPAEASIGHAEVGIRISPAAQSAHGIRVLPERGLIEVGSVYAAMRSRKASKTSPRSVLPMVQFQYGDMPV
jgi:hypothetical protein